MDIAVTGSTGFIGSSFVSLLRSEGHNVIPITRADFLSGDASFGGAQVLVHLAGIAHDQKADEKTIAAVNHRGAVDLAARSARAGISRFVFVSSVAAINPTTAYGRAKAAAAKA